MKVKLLMLFGKKLLGMEITNIVTFMVQLPPADIILYK